MAPQINKLHLIRLYNQNINSFILSELASNVYSCMQYKGKKLCSINHKHKNKTNQKFKILEEDDYILCAPLHLYHDMEIRFA